jgi:hypothetical protein
MTARQTPQHQRTLRLNGRDLPLVCIVTVVASAPVVVFAVRYALSKLDRSLCQMRTTVDQVYWKGFADGGSEVTAVAHANVIPLPRRGRR